MPDRSTRWRARIRQRWHPVHRLRGTRVFKVLASRFDRAMWVRLYRIRWPVRARLFVNATYFLDARGPEPSISALFIAIARVLSPRTFWDVGAHVGYYSFLLLTEDQLARVRAYEPDPGNAELIEETIRAHAVERIAVVTTALSDHIGRERFYADVLSRATGTLSERATLDGPSFDVWTSTIDAEALAHGVPDFVKIDVEGHEEHVLRGAVRTLAEHAPLLVFECFHVGRAADYLREFGYLIVDAETLREPTTGTSNYLALPPRQRDSIDGLRDRWRAELGNWV